MLKHEAQQKLAEYIEEYTSRLTKQGNSITTFTELWKAFSAVKLAAGQRDEGGSAVPFGSVLPIVEQAPSNHADILQLLLNKMAEDGYQIGRRAIRPHQGMLQYATDEDLSKNPRASS
jgi:hypothetical protein